MPHYGNPSLRLRFYADPRYETWNLTRTFLGTAIPLTDLNMRRAAAGAEVHAIVSSRWSWSAGAEVAHRNFRNLSGLTAPAGLAFFTHPPSIAGGLDAHPTLLRVPERPFTPPSTAEARAGKEYADGLGPFATVRG